MEWNLIKLINYWFGYRNANPIFETFADAVIYGTKECKVLSASMSRGAFYNKYHMVWKNNFDTTLPMVSMTICDNVFFLKTYLFLILSHNATANLKHFKIY